MAKEESHVEGLSRNQADFRRGENMSRHGIPIAPRDIHARSTFYWPEDGYQLKIATDFFRTSVAAEPFSERILQRS